MASRDNLPGIATVYGMDGRGVGVQVPERARFFFSTSFRPTLWPTKPPMQRETRILSQGVKRQGREADYAPPTTTEIKNTWIYPSISPYFCME
jgi:hypothetical protein